MYKYLRIGLIALITVLISCTVNVGVGPVTKEYNKKDKIDKREFFKSVARISAHAVVGKGALVGSAFAYDENTLITAGHVCVSIYENQLKNILRNDIQITYLNNNGKLDVKHNAEIIEIDEPHDICLIELKNHGLIPLGLGKYNSVGVGDTVYIVGAPAGVMVSAMQGEVMNPSTGTEFGPILKNKIIVSSAATGGSSGSAIVNDDGKVVGMLVRGHPTYDHLSIGTTVKTIKRFLKLVGR